MLTDKEFKQLESIIKKANKSLLGDLSKRMERVNNDSAENVHSMKQIMKRFDKLFPILEKLAKRQRILEKKMRAIEDYFDHRN